MVFHHRLARNLLFAVFPLLLGGFEVPAAAGDSGPAAGRKTLHRDPDPVVIKGALLVDLLGEDPSGHSSLNLTITRVQPGTYTFMQQWYHPHHFCPFQPGSTERYMDIRNHPLTIVTEHGKS
jgi:hypothetical protein